jgi:hypothetical protein
MTGWCAWGSAEKRFVEFAGLLFCFAESAFDEKLQWHFGGGELRGEVAIDGRNVFDPSLAVDGNVRPGWAYNKPVFVATMQDEKAPSRSCLDAVTFLDQVERNRRWCVESVREHIDSIRILAPGWAGGVIIPLTLLRMVLIQECRQVVIYPLAYYLGKDRLLTRLGVVPQLE